MITIKDCTRVLTFLIFAGLFISFKAGEPVATLECKSLSGRTIFSGVFPGCSYLENAQLQIDSSVLKFNFNEDEAYIVFEPENKVFTIYLESVSHEPAQKKFLKFWAIPSSFKKTNSLKGPGTQFHDSYEFTGKLYATEPRKISEPRTKTIELNCRLDYEL